MEPWRHLFGRGFLEFRKVLKKAAEAPERSGRVTV